MSLLIPDNFFLSHCDPPTWMYKLIYLSLYISHHEFGVVSPLEQDTRYAHAGQLAIFHLLLLNYCVQSFSFHRLIRFQSDCLSGLDQFDTTARSTDRRIPASLIFLSADILVYTACVFCRIYMQRVESGAARFLLDTRSCGPPVAIGRPLGGTHSACIQVKPERDERGRSKN